MLNTRKIREKYRDDICRRCINKRYKVDLVPQDCRYGMPRVCPRCKKARNIVVDFSFSGKMKMLFK